MSEMKTKKALYKRWWVWLIAAIIVIGIVTPKEEVVEKEATVPTTADTTDTTVKKEEPKETKPAAPKAKAKAKNKDTMSMAEFEQLKSGMTYEEAVKIIGGKGEVLSESGEEGTDFYTVMYMWDGEGEFGANSNIMFQGGKLNTKSQFGLK